MIHNFAKKLFSQIASIGKIFVNSKNLLQGAKKLLFETTKGVWEGNLTRRGSIINIATVVGESYSNGVRVIQNIDNLQVLLKPITKIVENVVEGCLKKTVDSRSLIDKISGTVRTQAAIKIPCFDSLVDFGKWVAANLNGQKHRVENIITDSKYRYHIDLAGDPHYSKSLGKDIPTPHIQREVKNIDPNGVERWFPDRDWVRSATKNDIGIAVSKLNK